MKVICGLMIINLLVGMILDNLSAIMNEVEHIETDDWRDGPSPRQIQEVTSIFKKFDARTGKIPLTCVRSLLHQMQQPFGFRDKQGQLRIGSHVSSHPFSQPISLCCTLRELCKIV